MSKYTAEQQKTINKVKKYLNALRSINQEKYSLELEYKDIPLPQSTNYSNEAPGGYSISKDEQITNRMIKRDLILKRLELFNEELDKFIPVTYLLSAGHRNIANSYVYSRAYTDMINTLETNYCIYESTYKRHFPKMCLKLAPYLDLDNIPSLEKLNKEFNEYVKELNKSNKLNDLRKRVRDFEEG